MVAILSAVLVGHGLGSMVMGGSPESGESRTLFLDHALDVDVGAASSCKMECMYDTML